MVTMFKLTTQNNTTHGGMKWEIGVTNRATVEGTRMCTNQVLHCYASAHQAVFFNPIHAGITNPKLFEIACSEIVATDGCKFATKEQTPVKELELPKLTTNQRVAIAIKCSLLVCSDKTYVTWADNWLSGKDRSYKSARAAAYATHAAAYATRAVTNYSYAADAACAAADADAANDFNQKLEEIIYWVIQNIE